MKPSDHLAYFSEHPTIKGEKKERNTPIALASARILSNFVDKYDSPVEIQAMRELDITRSILELLNMSKEASYIESIHEYINNQYLNPTK